MGNILQFMRREDRDMLKLGRRALATVSAKMQREKTSLDEQLVRDIATHVEQYNISAHIDNTFRFEQFVRRTAWHRGMNVDGVTRVFTSGQYMVKIAGSPIDEELYISTGTIIDNNIAYFPTARYGIIISGHEQRKYESDDRHGIIIPTRELPQRFNVRLYDRHCQ